MAKGNLKDSKKAEPKEDYSIFNDPIDSFSIFNNPINENNFSSDDESIDYGALLSGAGQEATLGYGPQLATMAEPIISRGVNLLSKNKVVEAPWSQMKPGTPEYIQARDEYVKSILKEEEESPKSFLSGRIAGGLLLGAPLATKTAATGIGRIGQASLAGAGVGALYNPGDEPGKMGDSQLDARTEQAVLGGIGGLGGGLLGEGVGKIGKTIAKSPEITKEMAEEYSLKSMGAMLKDLRRLYKKDRVTDISNELFDSKLVRPGVSVGDIADESKVLLDEAGEKIGIIYDKVYDATKNKIEALKPKMFDRLTSSVLSDDSMPKINRKEYLSKMQSVVDDILDQSNEITDPRYLNKMIGDVDMLINYSKKSNELPSIQKGYLAIRRELRDQLNELVGVIGKEIKEPKLKEEILNLNKRYSNLSDIHDISMDKAIRLDANRAISLTDTIAGGAGAVAGAATQSGPVSGAIGGLVGGALSAGLNKLGREYGAPITASAAKSISNKLNKFPKGLLKGVEKTTNIPRGMPVSTGIVGGGLINRELK